MQPGNFHPALVHFPVALVVTAAVAETVGTLRDQADFRAAARFMLHAAAYTSVLAAALGFFAAAGETYEDALVINFTFHRILGVAIPVLTFLTLGLCESARRTGEEWQRTAYQTLLLITTITVVIAAYLGGTLVFGADHFF
jgi:uncharacterized membrane protein